MENGLPMVAAGGSRLPIPAVAESASQPALERDVSVRPLSADEVWNAAGEVFDKYGYYSEFSKAKRGYDAGRECYWAVVSGVKPHEMDLILQRIGEKLETDFSMVCNPDRDDGIPKFLISFHAWQNLSKEETDAARERIEEWEALRLKCARAY